MKFACEMGTSTQSHPTQGTRRSVAIRPVMDSEVLPYYKKMQEPTEFEYGEYPQMETDKDTSSKLEKLFQEKSLKLTGKAYTFDSVDPEDSKTEFQPEKCPEYLHEGKKYIRVLARPYGGSVLRRGRRKPEPIKKGKPYWVEVQPIKWWKDIDGVWISQKALLGGIQLNSTKEHDWDDFDKKFMKRYLDTYFAKEIEPSKTIERTKSKKGLTALLSEQDREEIEKDDDVVRLRKERKDKIEQALKGTEKLEGKEKRKAELAILRKTNVQTLRDAEGKARAKKTAEILKKKQRTK